MQERIKQTAENLYLHGLNLFPQFGPARLYKIYKYLGGPKKGFSATSRELQKAGIEQEVADKFCIFRESINLEQEQEKLAKEEIGLINFEDSNYPSLLLEIPKFPVLLYYKGALGPADELCIAVVGTRKISNYGRTVIPYVVEPLVEAGVTIVSGMAFGVDSAAHLIPVNKNKRTVAVLAGGLDEKSLYPKAHALLAQNILDNGGLLFSEYPPGTPNFKQNFVARNRIISGMSVATVIVECDLKSGTLITAKHALEQNRNVYAVPGPIYSDTSKGPNNLIKMGARLITDANDILEDLNLKTLPEQKQVQSQFGDSPAETKLLQILNHEPIHINQLIKQTEIEAGDVMSALTFLEMKGKVRNLGGQQYVLSR